MLRRCSRSRTGIQKLTAKAAINPQAANAVAMAVAPSRSHRLHLAVVDEGSSTIR